MIRDGSKILTRQTDLVNKHEDVGNREEVSGILRDLQESQHGFSAFPCLKESAISFRFLMKNTRLPAINNRESH